MGEYVLWIMVAWGCAVLFTGLGIYAGKRKNPMWFWSGTTVPAETVADIPGYNRKNRTMWILYSVPFWISGVTYIWFPVFAGITILAACSVGVIWLIWYYKRIERKYVKNRVLAYPKIQK